MWAQGWNHRSLEHLGKQQPEARGSWANGSGTLMGLDDEWWGWRSGAGGRLGGLGSIYAVHVPAQAQ